MLSYFALANEVAQTSHDPVTKLGCVIVKDGVVVASGSNRFEREEDITPERLQRPLKYQWIKHAEHNALLVAGSAAHSSTLYCTAHPCKECAEKIAAAKIAQVVIPHPVDPELIARWQASWDEADAVLANNGVAVRYI